MPKINTFSVVPEEKSFYFCSGKKVLSVGELYKNIKNLTNNEFQHHCNDHKNDFYNWVFDVVQDTELAKEILGCRDKESIISSMQAYFASVTQPLKPKVLRKVTKKPVRETKKKISQQELKEEKPSGRLLNKVLGLRPEKKYKKAEISERDNILKILRSVYKIGR